MGHGYVNKWKLNLEKVTCQAPKYSENEGNVKQQSAKTNFNCSSQNEGEIT